MIPARLTINNFLCYGEDVPPLDLTGVHFACLSGDNGNGKTAVLDAITWALWGEARGHVDDDVIRLGQTRTSVDFEFYAHNTLYRVLRSRHQALPSKPGTSKLQLFIDDAGDWREISADTIRDTQAKIVDILHIDYATFINTAFLMQGRADEFVRKTPGQRKEILATILDLDHYDALAVRARTTAASVSADRKVLDNKLADIDSRLASLPDLQRQLDETRDQLAALQPAVTAISETLDSLKADSTARQHATAQLADANAAAAQRDRDARAASQTIATHKAHIDEYQKLIARAQAISTDQVLDRERQALAAAEETFATARANAVDANDRILALKAQLDATPDPTNEIARAKARHDDLLLTDRRLQQSLGAIQNALTAAEGLTDARTTAAAALAKATAAQSIYTDLATAFGKNGLQAIIIDAILPELAATANNLLARMSGDRMSLSLTTQRESQKGTTVETLDIRVSDETGTRSYETFSGGEAFRINLALRIALSRLLARRAGAPMPTLVIDEGFGSQDAQGLANVVRALHAIQDDFRCILVISHVADLQDAFPTRIQVTKTPNGSTIAVQLQEAAL